jgi:hypothetical protein
MEASSILLVATEVLLATFGILSFLWTLGKRKFGHGEVLLVLLAIASPFWFLLGDSYSRMVGVKATIFLGVLIGSIRWPRICLGILAALALSGFILDGIQTGNYLSKNVGLNSNRILAVPFGLIGIICILLLPYFRFKKILLLVLISVDLLFSLQIEIRAGILSAAIGILVLFSQRFAKYFVKGAVYFPFVYVLLVFVSYLLLSEGTNLLEYTPSNFERSSMIYASLVHFFDYLFSGPQISFDLLAQGYLNSFDWIVYENEKGVIRTCFCCLFGGMKGQF